MILIVKSKKHGEKEVLIDDSDFFKVSQLKWHLLYDKCINGFYIITTLYTDNKKRTVYLHRFVMGCPKDKIIDHINHNTLDNRRCNLRICTKLENNKNVSIRKNKITSKLKGIYFKKADNKYVAQIGYNKNKIHIGYFKTEKEAYEAYNNKALELFGEYANLNIIEETV